MSRAGLGSGRFSSLGESLCCGPLVGSVVNEVPPGSPGSQTATKRTLSLGEMGVGRSSDRWGWPLTVGDFLSWVPWFQAALTWGK